MIGRPHIALALALLAATPLAAAGPAGSYRLTGEHDVASELVLLPDGRFRYFLAAGSLDEQAEGRWTAAGGALHLTTLPHPTPATFAAGPVASVADERLVLHVTDPAGHGIAAVYFTIGFDSGAPVEGYTQDYGWSLDQDETRAPRWIGFSVPIYGLRSQRFAIDPAKGNALTFILTPNDLGIFVFDGVTIDLRPGGLVIHRDGGQLNYAVEAEER